MTQKAKRHSPSETKEMYLGLRSSFVVLWFALIIILTNTDLLYRLYPVNPPTADNGNMIVAALLLVPIAIAVFPVMYRANDIYSVDEKRSVIPVWQRYVVGLTGTALILCIVLCLFTIVSLTLFYKSY